MLRADKRAIFAAASAAQRAADYVLRLANPIRRRRASRWRPDPGAAHDPRRKPSSGRWRSSPSACATAPALTSPDTVRDYLRLLLHDRGHEVFVCVFLDAQHRVIATEELFRGTLAQTSVYPREVVKATLAHNAAAVIFAHNHPSGVCEPSRADELLTQTLKQALALVDVKVLDHFVVAGAGVGELRRTGTAVGAT